MRAVKCPSSDATASAAPSEGQLEEELLLYSQCYCKPSTTCCQDSAFHLQTTGSVDELFPISYRWALPRLHRLILGAFCEFSWLFVCLFCSVSMLAPLPVSDLPLPPTQIPFSCVSIFSDTQTHILTQTLVFSNSLSSNSDELLWWCTQTHSLVAHKHD